MAIFAVVVLGIAVSAARAARVPFVVMSKQHCGTSLFREAVSSHHRALMWTEIFVPILPDGTGCGAAGSPLDRVDMVWGFQEWRQPTAIKASAYTNVSNCLCGGRAECALDDGKNLTALLAAQRAVGFTWLERQSPDWAGPEQARILEHVRRRGARVVVLERTNFLAHAVACAGLARRATRTLNGVDVKQSKREHDRLTAAFDGLVDAAVALDVPVLRLSYEQLSQNVSVFDTVFRFLGLPETTEKEERAAPSWTYALLNRPTRRPAAYLANLDDVSNDLHRLSAAVPDHDFLCMLNDTCALKPVQQFLHAPSSSSSS